MANLHDPKEDVVYVVNSFLSVLKLFYYELNEFLSVTIVYEPMNGMGSVANSFLSVLQLFSKKDKFLAM